mmetsp:Transcript_9420/g.25418  ORF Transcript_9420/g.25418 Transcript_9420/m.25418 type:complete len:96 (-) Transcript_9420:1409-1696(-)|eukprot:1065396-Pelagomonas_calceolata.AAC.13
MEQDNTMLLNSFVCPGNGGRQAVSLSSCSVCFVSSGDGTRPSCCSVGLDHALVMERGHHAGAAVNLRQVQLRLHNVDGLTEHNLWIGLAHALLML